MTQTTTRSERKLVTPNAAALMLENKWATQRKLNQLYVRQLADSMTAGKFEFELQTVTLARWPGAAGAIVLDGQHRLAAQVMSGKSGVISINHHCYSSERDAMNSYALLDRGRRRTNKDIARAICPAELSHTAYANLRAAVTYMLMCQIGRQAWGGRPGDVEIRAACDTTMQTYLLLQSVLPASMASNKTGRNGPGNAMELVHKLSRSYSLGVALASVVDNQAASLEFWPGVCALIPTNTTTALAQRTLLGSSGCSSAEFRAAARRLASAYVSYRDGASPRMLKAVKPVELAGLYRF